jgi:hypothetical protein
MRKAFGLTLAGLGAVLLTGAAAAASQDSHVMNVPLPDGSTARVEYVGDVAPKVTVTPRPFDVAFPDIDWIDQGMFDIQRRIEAIMRNMRTAAPPSSPAAPGMNVAAYGDLPAGSSSVTIVTTSNGSKTCTRRTDVTPEGPGKAPKVVSSVSGDCGNADGEPLRSGNSA